MGTIPVRSESPNQETQAKVKCLLDNINSSTGYQRVAAEAELRAMGRDAARSMNDLFLPQVQDWKTRSRRSGYRAISYVVGMVVAWVFLFVAQRAIGIETANNAALCLSLTFIIAVIADLVITSSKISDSISSILPAIHFVLRQRDAAVVPLMLELHAGTLPHNDLMQIPIEQVLIETLPTVQKRDAPLFSRRERKKLNRILRRAATFGTSQRPQLAVAALHVLEMLGDESSIDITEQLTNSCIAPSIRSAASTCLPKLKERSVTPANMLLRAASASVIDADILMRAASETTDLSDEELLCPVYDVNPD